MATEGAAASDQNGAVATPVPADPYLVLEGVEKRFGRTTALSRIDLSIGRGELVCFLGPSGCGKTTLLRAIAGLDLPSAGTIRQDGRDVTLLPPSERDFGIVFQSYALFPNLTVAENVGYGLSARGRDREAVALRVRELLALIGLGDKGGRYPAELSGGQQQRVALARALAPAPGLLLLDEPLSALDARVRAHLRHEIRALQQRLGVTTILVTHDQEEALTMADRVVVMAQGRIAQVGTPREIYAAPSDPFVAGFVGAMTLLDADVSGDGEVAVGSLVMRCPAAEGLPPRTPVRIGIRPEEVQVLPAEVPKLGAPEASRPSLAALFNPFAFLAPLAMWSATKADNGRQAGFTATVVDVAYLGALRRITVRPSQEPGLALLADVAADAGMFAPGTQCRVVLPAERLRVFREAQAGVPTAVPQGAPA